jgi:fatty-acyl-CoA synthase
MRAFAATLNEALLARSSDAKRGFSFLRADGSESFFTFARLAEESRRRASALASHGLTRGDRVVLIVPEPEDFVLAFLGAVAGGFVPVPMFPPFAARDLSVFESGVEHVVRASGAKLRVTTASLDRTLSPHARNANEALTVVTTEQLAVHPGTTDIHDAKPEDLAFLQFTSGSTARPKGVMVSHANLAANSRAFMLDGLQSDPDVDTGVSWLPLFHDMGLIGFVIGPIFASVSVTFIPTASFVRRPLLWLETIAKKKASITYAPNFAYELVAKRLKSGDAESLDLSSLKHAGCGAEPISATTLRAFAEKLAPAKFAPSSFLPSYGMAEATLAVTFGGYQRGMRTETRKEGTGDREIVACGRAFEGHEVAIWNDEGNVVADGEVGHIMVRGPSVCRGYYGNDDDVQERNRTTFDQKNETGGGWLRTGDLGYLRAGDLFVCGRSKDLIIVRGRNYYPSDIEWAVSDVAGVRKGAVVAFSVDRLSDESRRDVSAVSAGEKLVIVAEAATSDPVGLRAEIARVVLERFALSVGDVELLTPSGLPRTSSGKLQRAKTKELYSKSALPRLRSERAESSTASAPSAVLQGSST